MQAEKTKNHIILIGMPASGKSTAGLLLARSLCLNFIDTDILIQQDQGQTLQRIIDRQGMAAFLQIEEAIILKQLSGLASSVIATGGSVVLSDQAMTYLKTLGTIVWLDVATDQLVSRLKDIKSRGIAMAPGQTVADLIRQRQPFYRKHAQKTIQISSQGLEETVSLIMAALGAEKCAP